MADTRDDTPVIRQAPQWAWDIIDQTLEMDSQSISCSRDLREEIKAAYESMEDYEPGDIQLSEALTRHDGGLAD